MSRFRVTFRVPAEVLVDIDADDEDQAADAAWELAQQHLSTVSVTSSSGVTVMADLDGIGADEVTPR